MYKTCAHFLALKLSAIAFFAATSASASTPNDNWEVSTVARQKPGIYSVAVSDSGIFMTHRAENGFAQLERVAPDGSPAQGRVACWEGWGLWGVTHDPFTGTLYFSQSNGGLHQILQLSGEGGSIVATSNKREKRKGCAQLKLRCPAGIARDEIGALYVADAKNSRICRFSYDLETENWRAETIGSSFRYPQGVACDPSGGKVYVADTGNNRICEISFQQETNSWITSVISGATSPREEYNRPCGIAFRGDGDLVIADTDNHRIRRLIRSSGKRTWRPITIAGASALSGDTDGTGSSARFRNPYGLSCHKGDIYVADFGNNTVRRLKLISEGGKIISSTTENHCLPTISEEIETLIPSEHITPPLPQAGHESSSDSDSDACPTAQPAPVVADPTEDDCLQESPMHSPRHSQGNSSSSWSSSSSESASESGEESWSDNGADLSPRSPQRDCEQQRPFFQRAEILAIKPALEGLWQSAKKHVSHELYSLWKHFF